MKMDEPGGAAASPRISLTALEQHRGFVDRHIGTSDDEQAEMLELLGYPTRAALIISGDATTCSLTATISPLTGA